MYAPLRSRSRIPRDGLAVFFVLAIIVGWLTGIGNGWGGDWVQYRGPRGDGTSAERILREWPVGGPRVIWRKSLPDGFSSMAVGGGRVYTALKRQVNGVAREVFVALDAESGVEIWSRGAGVSPRQGISGEGDGPRSTPVIDGDRVYVLDASVALYCLRASDGVEVWKRDLLGEFGGRVPDFDASASPLIEGDLVLVNGPVGGSGERLFGMDKRDGHTVWSGPSAKLTHSTPVAVDLLGVRQVIFFTGGGIVSVAPKTGQELWRHSFEVSIPVVMSPLIGGDIIYHSAGYGVGARAIGVTRVGEGYRTTELWRKRGQLMNFISSPVFHEGHIYGMFGDKKYGVGPLACVELATGIEKWSKSGFGVGQLVVVDGHLLVQDEDGALVLLKPDPEQYIEVARFQAMNTKAWNGPAISNGRIYARTTKEAVCLDVTPPPLAKLRLWPGVVGEGRFRLRVGLEDGLPLEAGRAGRLSFLSARVLDGTGAVWMPWPVMPVLTNGQLEVEDLEVSKERQRFFRVLEKP